MAIVAMRRLAAGLPAKTESCRWFLSDAAARATALGFGKYPIRKNSHIGGVLESHASDYRNRCTPRLHRQKCLAARLRDKAPCRRSFFRQSSRRSSRFARVLDSKLSELRCG